MPRNHRVKSLHLRLNLTRTVGLGPGKADLLEHVAKSGSISAAAKTMGMSYRRAWLLIDDLNSSFKQPVVAKSKGGKGGGGGAMLTPWGNKVLGLYRRIERSAQRVATPALATLIKNLA
jgi:molybdate transport system regulatory protein